MAYQRYGTSNIRSCDSYFVESYDNDYQPSRVCPKEHAKIIARERQYAMGDEMTKAVREEYQEDIIAHMHLMDSATLPDVDSIDIQTEIQWFMRPYLLDFLIEAHAAFQLLPGTLFLTVNLLDRYCSKRVVYKRHYQLVGCAALLIAAKYSDKKERVPTIKELKSMCCSLYDDDMFVQMEWHVLQTLGWSIGHPTVDGFLQVAVMDTPYDPEVEHLALYILEIALFHREFVSKLSADLSRAALALSRCILNRSQASHNDWASNYDSLTLVNLSQHLFQPSHVLARKYSSAHYSRVSKILEQFLARQSTVTKSYNPPTPPTDRAEDSKPYEGEIGLATPQKSHCPRTMTNGYITPPITPENDAFAPTSNANPSKDASGLLYVCPTSPTPQQAMHYGQTHHYKLQETDPYSQHQRFRQQPSVPYNSVF
uniref:G2/mitotic-specific cyclin-4 n=1 Tax=Coccidioides posadasii RMSCC 3488 TaxID=454284 RepID=A0A0J6FFT6_COCPO|nr:G2/mitotic-specific cyclin-4 [Coccidioides posadasii RMSCC 3488]